MVQTMQHRHFNTSDGVRLHYLEAGSSGRPLVMIHGWSASAAVFKRQFDALTKVVRVIAVDMRGCRESDKPDHGYRVSRYAADLRDLLDALDLQEVDLLGQSMGASVIWCYLDLFGHENRIKRLILVDGTPPCASPKPGWSDEEKFKHGVLLEYEALSDFFQETKKATTAEAVKASGRMNMFVSKEFPEEDLDFFIEEAMKFPREYAAEILYDVSLGDWRDVPRRITLPTLAITCRGRPSSEQRHAWLATQMPHARIEYFNPDEGGSHMMFFENPEKFNRLVVDFLVQT